VLKEQDFFDMAWAYFERAAADHVVHAELFFDPQTHTDRGVPIRRWSSAWACLLARAAEFGISAKLILCFLRHLSEEAALATLRRALPYRQHFIGVGLDSGERGNPPENLRACSPDAANSACMSWPMPARRARRRHRKRARCAQGRTHRPRRALRPALHWSSAWRSCACR
jgi:hypothetical protein